MPTANCRPHVEKRKRHGRMTDHYRHLIEGQREQDRRQLDDYLARADTAARINAIT